MSCLILQRRRYSQPSDAVEVDPSYDIVACGIGGSSTNLATREPGAVNATIELRAGLAGQYKAPTNTAAYEQHNGDYFSGSVGSMLLVAETYAIISSNTGVLGPTTSTLGFYFKVNSGNRWRFSVFSGTQKDAIDTTAPGIGVVNTLVGTTDATTVRLYRNGVETATVAAGAYATGSDLPIRVGASALSQASVNTGVYLWAVSNRPWTAAEAAALGANPWQIFKAK